MTANKPETPDPPKRQITECRNVVFLLGAGASVHYKLPVMARFMDIALDKYFARRLHNPEEFLTDRYGKLVEFHHACSQSAVAFNRDWANLEELYTQADLLRLSKIPSAEAAEELCKAIAWAIWDTYRIPSVQPRDQDLWRRIAQRVWDARYRPVIITTNYDISVETDLWRAGQSYYPGFEIDKPLLRPRQMNHGADSIPVIKLHGSVNWFSHTKTKEWFALNPMQACDPIRSPDFHEPGFTEFLRRLHGNEPLALDDVEPAIVPPMLGKALTADILATHWREAILALRSARIVMVVGYSFPATDAFMSRLLSEGLKDNSQLREFYVIDYGSRTDWEVRLRRMVTPAFADTKLRLRAEKLAREFLDEVASQPLSDWHKVR